MAGQKYQPKNVTARVYSIVSGVKEMQRVRLIRIKSRTYNLLIMEDYMPVLGEIDGDVTIQTEDETYTLQGIYGFYMHQDNQFRLMLKEKREEI